jgi:hypothetical protein
MNECFKKDNGQNGDRQCEKARERHEEENSGTDRIVNMLRGAFGGSPARLQTLHKSCIQYNTQKKKKKSP